MGKWLTSNESAFNLLNVLYTDQIIEELHISKSDDPDTSSAKLQGETSGDLSGFDMEHNSEMGSDDSVVVNKLLTADTEGIKLDIAVIIIIIIM